MTIIVDTYYVLQLPTQYEILVTLNAFKGFSQLFYSQEEALSEDL